MSAKHNLVCEQAATFNLNFTVKTGDTAWNLTGYTATMTVRPYAGSPVTTLSATTVNGKVVLGGSAGTVAVTVPAAETLPLTPGRYVYDFILNSGGTVTRLLEGKFVVTAGVTV